MVVLDIDGFLWFFWLNGKLVLSGGLFMGMFCVLLLSVVLDLAVMFAVFVAFITTTIGVDGGGRRLTG